MTKIIVRLTFIICLITIVIGCASEDMNRISKSDLPERVQLFLSDNFSNYTIAEISELVPSPDYMGRYKVRFTDNTTATFNDWGYWMQLESTQPLPAKVETLLSEEEIAALRSAYPDAPITGLYRTQYGYRITLVDGKQIAVYPANNQIVIGKDLTNEMDKVPQNIQTYMRQYFEGYSISSLIWAIEKDTELYKISFRVDTNGVICSTTFDKDGNWIAVFGNEDAKKAIPDALLQTLPKVVKDYMAERYTHDSIYFVVKHAAYYQFYIGAGKHVQVNPRTGVFIIPTKQVLDFVRSHFSQNNNISFSDKMNLDEDFISYYFKIEVDGFKIEINTDEMGYWQMIGVEGKPMPHSVLNTLMPNLGEKIAQAYPGKVVSKIAKTKQGYLFGIGNVTVEMNYEGVFVQEIIDKIEHVHN